MERRFKQVFTSIKEHGSVSYAKIAAMGGFQDLDIIIIKATSPEDLPLEEKYIHDLVKTFTASPSAFRAYSLSFSRRFGKTGCWRVALKCLVLLHRLIRSLPHESPIRDEIVWARYRGLLSLDRCYFRDSSSSCSEYYTVFIRSYARLLDEALDCLSLGTNKIYQELEEVADVKPTISEKMKEVDNLLVLLPQQQSLIDRIIDCKPIGPAQKSFLVQSAMKQIIRDSFVAYKNYRKDEEILLEMLMQMPYRSGLAAFGIYKKASTQAEQLNNFYDWCKSLNLCGPYEYPAINKIPNIQINALETFFNNVWQSSESTPSTNQSPFHSVYDDMEYQEGIKSEIDEDSENKEGVKSQSITSIVEMEPLIKFDEIENDDSWEALLESSISPTNDIFFNHRGFEYGQTDMLQVYIHYPQGLGQFSKSSNTNPNCPGGL